LAQSRTSAAEPKERGTLRGHTNEVLSIAITPDGKTLVSGSLDKTIKLWDLSTGTQRATLKGHSHSVHSIALAADGKTLASASRDGAIKLWDLVTLKEQFSLKVPPFGGICVAITADCRTLAAGTGAKGVLLWDLENRRERAFRTEGVRSVAFTPDGRALAVGGSELPGGRFIGTLRLWDVPTGKEQARLPVHGGGVRFLAFTADGRTLASCSLDDSTVKLWEVLTGKERATFRGLMEGGTCPAFAADGSMLAAGGEEEGTVKLWDLSAHKELATLKGDANFVHALAFTPDGKTLASAEGPDTAIRLWDLSGLRNFSKQPATALANEELEALWTALASADAARAYQSIWALARAPRQAVPWVQERLSPVAAVEPPKLARLLASLDSDAFPERERATIELEKLGEALGPALRKVLTEQSSLEMRRRVKRLLEKLEPTASPENLRVLRALEVLEHIGTAEARRVLERLADGTPEARLTREAKASLARLVDRCPGPSKS
jgi:WD40 repeat protein